MGKLIQLPMTIFGYYYFKQKRWIKCLLMGMLFLTSALEIYYGYYLNLIWVAIILLTMYFLSRKDDKSEKLSVKFNCISLIITFVLAVITFDVKSLNVEGKLSLMLYVIDIISIVMYLITNNFMATEKLQVDDLRGKM